MVSNAKSFFNKANWVLVFGLSISSTQMVKAELVELSQAKNSVDRIEQLTQTLSDGTYSTEANDLYRDSNIILRSTQNEDSAVIVKPEDYAKLKIKPIFSDSRVVYLAKDDVYFEIKNFPNNISMYYNIDNNYAIVLDNDNEKPYENSWKVSCSRDSITDEKSCVMGKFALGIIKSSKSGTMLTVSSDIKKLNLYKFSYIRIDKNQHHKTKGIFLQNSATKIINQMRVGETAFTRFNEWDGEEYEEVISLWGFSVAYDLMGKMYNRLK